MKMILKRQRASKRRITKKIKKTPKLDTTQQMKTGLKMKGFGWRLGGGTVAGLREINYSSTSC